MRKLAVTALAVVAILLVVGLIVGTLFWKRLSPPSLQPEAFLPAETILLAEAVDLTRTGLRWRDTEMYKLWKEPEVQAFLEKPLATFQPFQQMGKMTDDLSKLWPRQAFVAVVGLAGNNPRIVAGYSYQGDRQAGDRLLAEPRQKMKSSHPAGHTSLVLHGKTEIQTYVDDDFVFAEAEAKDWHFFTNDVEALKSTLDRLQAGEKSQEPRLTGDADFQKALAPLPNDPELRIFVRTGVFVDRIVTALNSSGTGDPNAFVSLRQQRALAATSKLEGGQIRDSLFKLEGSATPEKGETPKAAAAPEPPLARTALELTRPDTSVFLSLGVGKGAFQGMPVDLVSALPLLGNLALALQDQQATWADLPLIFEPEVSLLLQKGAGGALAGVLAIPVRDAVRAQRLLQSAANGGRALTVNGDHGRGDFATGVWSTSTANGHQVFTLPASGMLKGVAPILLPTDRYWLLSLSGEGAASLLDRAKDAPQLTAAPSYQELTKRVGTPGRAFGFMNLGALVEQGYNTAKPLAALALVGNADLGKSFDAGKLPSGSILGQHIGPLVISQRAVAGGRLWEELGNVSLAHLFLASAVAYASTGPDLSKLIQAAASAGFPVAPGSSAAPTPEPPPAAADTPPAQAAEADEAPPVGR